jgi:NADH-quinone oxidoreductase subunit A
MSESGLSNYAIVLLFTAGGIVFSLLGLMVSRILAPKQPNIEKETSYESGEEPLKNARIQYNPGYFIIALIFLLFEVEIIFLFPWALVFDNEYLNGISNDSWGTLALIEMFIFIAILFAGLFFVWRKGFLSWPAPKIEKETFRSGIPSDLYDEFNRKYQ